MCYGGGIKNVDQIEKIIGLGVEKVSVGSSAIRGEDLITAAAERVGSQSVVGVIDFKTRGKLFKKYEVMSNNGATPTGLDPVDYANQLISWGVGEILLSSVDQDGCMRGYDLTLISRIKTNAKIPLTLLGGASSLSDCSDLFKKYENVGAAAGSLFVFKGKYRAVLIQYPDLEARKHLY